MSAILETSREGRLLRVALNRPEKRNALNLELCQALADTLEKAADDPAIGAILLTANGKSFCAGMDLNEALSAETGAIGDVHERLFTIGSRIAKPLVMAIHGAALAGGTGLAANGHVVIASDDATFGLTEVRIGLWPFVVFRAVALAIGERRAVELSLTGRIVSAREARDFGLVHQVAPAAELEARAEETAKALADASPIAVQSGLRFVRDIRGRNWEEAGRLACEARERVFQSPDFREGVRAFQEKRAPRWPSLT